MKRSSDRSDKGDDTPPMSRLFVICSKTHTEADFQAAFEEYGKVEEIYMVKDRVSGEKKGVCYVKFSKTSEAAHALEALNGKAIGPEGRSIKVVVASSRDKGNKRYADEEERYLRLFVIIPKDMTESELRDEFQQYGNVTDITILHSKTTKDGKCFAYIKFKKFSDTANAIEQCDPKYKAVFAEPKPPKNDMNNSSMNMSMSGYNMNSSYSDMGRGGGGGGFDHRNDRRMSDDFMHYGGLSGGMIPQQGVQQETTLTVLCSPLLTQDQLWRLFDIIPGLDYCRLHDDINSRSNTATVVYTSYAAAKHAKEKLHGFEYPLGERLIVKIQDPSGGGGGMAGGDPFNFEPRGRDDVPCSVPLPPIKPLAPMSATCRKRLFIVCTNGALPANVLKNVFCRFNDLIEVFLLPGKTCGYALYASETSAEDCMRTLHGSEVAGIRLKAMEADEPNQGRKRLRQDDNMQ